MIFVDNQRYAHGVSISPKKPHSASLNHLSITSRVIAYNHTQTGGKLLPGHVLTCSFPASKPRWFIEQKEDTKRELSALLEIYVSLKHNLPEILISYAN